MRRLDGGFVRKIVSPDGRIDDHELQRRSNGDFVYLVYQPRRHVDLTGIGGPADATVLDAHIEEISPDGKLVWSWSSAGRIGLDESSRWYETILGTTIWIPGLDGRPEASYDFFHANAVSLGKSFVLLSLRQTDGVYAIDRASGRILWKLGGTPTPESLTVVGDPYGDAPLGGQHDVRLLSDGTVSVFDDGTFENRPPRVVRYRIDATARTATLVQQIVDPAVTVSNCCGSARLMADGDWLVSWGGDPVVGEYRPDGTPVFTLTFADGLFSYRAVPVGAEPPHDRGAPRRHGRDGEALIRTMRPMPVRVRMAPSPTGLLHIGNVRTALFNWLYARHEGGEFRLRIENTDTSREVAEAVDHIQESLRWLGLDWDGPHTFQLDRMEDCRRVAGQLVAEGKAYEDEGAIRFRMPDEGATGWDDVVRGRVEIPNETIEDVVIVRSDGRPTYNFASPLEDVWDGITHVIRGEDHISNTPKQINLIRAVGGEPPVYAHVPNVAGADGKKLSKRHGAVTVAEFRRDGYLPETLLNFLALLGWAPDGETTIMSRDELVERFTLERVSSSPAQFDYAKLDWMNGVYMREALTPDEFAHRLVLWLGEQGYAWDAELVARAAPLVQEKISRLSEFPAFAGFLFEEVEPAAAELAGGAVMLAAAEAALAGLEQFDAGTVEAALRAAAERLELKPRQAFQPVRIAVTGSRVSPGLFESIELLGRETTLARLQAAAAAAAA